MKFAVTADLHLGKQKPAQRVDALKAVCRALQQQNISALVIAGDLFDANERNYADFEAVCKSDAARGITFYIIPGNHDSELNARLFAANNIHVFSQPDSVRFDIMSMPVVFVPYIAGRNMGQLIQTVGEREDLEPDNWILVSHGDWVETLGEPNPLEPGLYMPLTRKDLDAYKPAAALLGHIHKPFDSAVVHYPGSPCPLDINETGHRRILTVDSETGAVDPLEFEEPLVYFNETLLVLPVDNEDEYVGKQAAHLLAKWNIHKHSKTDVRIRIKVRGYTKDRAALAGIIDSLFRDFRFYNDEEPDLSEVYVSDDAERNDIARKTREAVRALSLAKGEIQPGIDDILVEAMNIIYGD